MRSAATWGRCREGRRAGKSDASLFLRGGTDGPDTAPAGQHDETAPDGCVGSGGRRLEASRGELAGRTPGSSSDPLDHSAGRGRTPGGNRREHRPQTGRNPGVPVLGARGWTIIEAVCEKEVLSRVPVIRPEGPGCSRLRALTLSAPVAGTIYLSSDHVRNGRERSYSGRFRFLHFLVVIDRCLRLFILMTSSNFVTDRRLWVRRGSRASRATICDLRGSNHRMMRP